MTLSHEEVTVLLVEDNDVDVEATRRAFGRHRIANRVVVAHDGIEALEVLRGEGEEPLHQPYIILLDLNMPRMNGIEFLQEIRSDPDLKKSVVFIVTTSDADKDRVRSYDLNVAGYIVKSNIGPDFERLIGMLDSYWKVVTLPRDHH